MSPREWGRRDFLFSMGGGALALAAGTASRLPSSIRTVRIGCVLPSGSADRSSGTEAGILLGREEAEQVGALLRVELDVRVERVGSLEEVEAAAGRLLADGVQVVVGAVEPPGTLELRRTTARAGVIVVDAHPSSVAPPTATDPPCEPPAFRVGMDPATGMGLALEALAMGASGPTILVGDPGEPQLVRAQQALARLGGDTQVLDAATPARTLSDELRALDEGGASAPTRVLLVGPAALARAFDPGAFGTAHPVFATTPIHPGEPLPVVPVHAPALWHPGLVRFGAAQLNERHERRFETPMDPAAWAGWFVMKLLWEVILREGDGGTWESLGERLMDPATRFDGHKGVGIGFRSDGLLRQPLYLVRTDPDGGSEVVHEAPAAAPGTPFVDAFDSLGPPESACPLAPPTP